MKRVISEAGVFSRRHKGKPKPEEEFLFETDMYELYPRSVNELTDAAAYHEVNNQINTVDWQLRSFNKTKLADDFQKWVRRARRQKTNAELTDVTVREGMTDIKELMEEVAAAHAHNKKMGPHYGEDVYNAVVGNMYNSAIGLNRELLEVQFAQPFLVGAAEVGPINVLAGMTEAYGRVLVGTGKGTYKDMLKLFKDKKISVNQLEAKMLADPEIKRIHKRLLPTRVDPTMLTEPQRAHIKKWAKLMGIPGELGIQVFTFLDKMNRLSTFFGANRQWDAAVKSKNISKALETFHPWEKKRVLNRLAKGDWVGARDVHGYIAAKRVNYYYDLSARGDFFGSSVGRRIPFTTWGQNALDLHLQGLDRVIKAKGGKAKLAQSKRLADLVGLQIAGMWAMQFALNQKYHTSATPQFDIPGTDVTVPSIEVGGRLPMKAIVLAPDLLTVPKMVISGAGVAWVKLSGIMWPDVRKDRERERRKKRKERKARRGKTRLEYSAPIQIKPIKRKR